MKQKSFGPEKFLRILMALKCLQRQHSMIVCDVLSLDCPSPNLFSAPIICNSVELFYISMYAENEHTRVPSHLSMYSDGPRICTISKLASGKLFHWLKYSKSQFQAR